MTLYEKMLKLSSQGFACAQIMMILVLENEGKEDCDLIRTMGALNNGFRDCGLICGAFTGGACVISYFAGQGEPDEVPDSDYDKLIQELYSWFEDEVGGEYGGITCPAILAGDRAHRVTRCPKVVENTFYRVIGTLEEHGFI
ncbi:MAG: C-GCAxxG-C-C family protein [Coriobacteriales bacterium]|jgi:hypothetical protein|nr:C-GCAxxG-C-C family protein [Coriobacteriales bacterium]